ncbi:hypothetical protein [Emticicia sp. SJ17W-69]|uniref:hypothetical protein n=1 Tax=Emticicia sp. SJ17W-69 TaxID=3421657 RepID=UPI003EBA6025
MALFTFKGIYEPDIVAEGKLIGETSYLQQADKNQELEISAEVFNDKSFVTCKAKNVFFDTIRGAVNETKKNYSQRVGSCGSGAVLFVFIA